MDELENIEKGELGLLRGEAKWLISVGEDEFNHVLDGIGSKKRKFMMGERCNGRGKSI